MHTGGITDHVGGRTQGVERSGCKTCVQPREFYSDYQGRIQDLSVGGGRGSKTHPVYSKASATDRLTGLGVNFRGGGAYAPYVPLNPPVIMSPRMMAGACVCVHAWECMFNRYSTHVSSYVGMYVQ